MIEDFLEVNELDGRIISFPADTTPAKALEFIHLPSNAYARAIPFFDEKYDFFVVIASAEGSITIKDAEDLFPNKKLTTANEKKVYNFSSFEKQFFPPISVYEAKVALHSSVKEKKTLFFQLSHREFLLIKTSDILKANEIENEVVQKE